MSSQPTFSNGEIKLLIDALDACDGNTSFASMLFSETMGSKGESKSLPRDERRQQIVLLKAKLIQMMEKVS